MADAGDRTRRSFMGALLTTAAGGWVALTGVAASASLLSGCPVAMKYGGPSSGPGPGPATTTPPPPPPRRRDPAEAPSAPPPAKKSRPIPGPTGGTIYGGPNR